VTRQPLGIQRDSRCGAYPARLVTGKKHLRSSEIADGRILNTMQPSEHSRWTTVAPQVAGTSSDYLRLLPPCYP